VDELTTNDYHRIADEYLETLVDHLEELSEDSPQVDVEYSQGVLTLEMPPLGTYVINKQPPNKQIWVSSPESGPDRFDPIGGKWVSLRTGELLGNLLRRELGEALEREVDLEGLD
jgi:frataxin